MNIPGRLFHSSPPENRSSISSEGLILGHSDAAVLSREMGDPDWMIAGAIFLTSSPEDIDAVDVWEVDVLGLALEPDDTTECPHEGVSWWQVRQPICPSRLTLHRAATHRPVSISPGI